MPPDLPRFSLRLHQGLTPQACRALAASAEAHGFHTLWFADRCRPMLGLKSTGSARRYCRGHDELRNFLRCRSRMRQRVPAATRRWQHMRRAAIALGILETA